MNDGPVVIGVVAPGRRIEEAMAEQVTALARTLHGDRVAVRFHPQCFLSHGHFAGDDAARAAAFVSVANDPDVDAVWFGRGGYGACRLLDQGLENLSSAAREKTYLGYSDAGFLLGYLYANAIGEVAHGPMPADITRVNGEAAVARALDWLVGREPTALEPSLIDASPTAAFNLTTLSHLIGTPAEPPLSGHVVMVEDIDEHHYEIDRAAFQTLTVLARQGIAGLRLGRCSSIPVNDIAFGADETEIAQDWCARTGVPYLGRADIGHDADNRIVPFGAP